MRKDVMNVDGKVVGQIIDGVLYKKVRASRHMLKKPEGWGLDSPIFEDEFGEVKILDQDNNICYVSKREAWLEHGLTINRGHGPQIVLPLRWHEARHPKQSQLL